MVSHFPCWSKLQTLLKCCKHTGIANNIHHVQPKLYMSRSNFYAEAFATKTKSFCSLIDSLFCFCVVYLFCIRWYRCGYFCDHNLLNIQSFSHQSTEPKTKKKKKSSKGSIDSNRVFGFSPGKSKLIHKMWWCWRNVVLLWSSFNEAWIKWS